jgi:hypothetical protein
MKKGRLEHTTNIVPDDKKGMNMTKKYILKDSQFSAQ